MYVVSKGGNLVTVEDGWIVAVSSTNIWTAKKFSTLDLALEFCRHDKTLKIEEVIISYKPVDRAQAEFDHAAKKIDNLVAALKLSPAEVEALIKRYAK